MNEETWNIPDTREELKRKAVDVLAHAAGMHKAGRMDKRTAWVIANTVWSLTAGLVDEEISSLASSLANEINCPGYRRYFISAKKGGSPLVLVLNPDVAYALVKIDTETGERTQVKRQARGDMDPIDFRQHTDLLIKQLSGAGYIEL